MRVKAEKGWMMETNKELDQWAAEKIGLTVYVHQDGRIKVLTIPKHWKFDKGIFTLSDARCREIVREHFEISTNRGHWNDGIEVDHWYSTTEDNKFEADGKSIEEAEIACIAAIMEDDHG